MDFMFEDEVDEVGSDVEAYCPKCKADTTHVVISKYEDEIRRVQCNPCGDVHSFRKPRGEVEDDVPEPIAAKKRAMLKKQSWDEFFAKHGEKQGKPYEFRERYSENTIVTHPKFGRGFVSEVISDSKVEITFKDARRVLVHNRKDMPGLPLAAEGDGIPSKGPKAKAVKSKAAKEERVAAKSAAPATAPVAPPAPAAKGTSKGDGATGKATEMAKADVHAKADGHAKPDGHAKADGKKGAPARGAPPPPPPVAAKAAKAEKGKPETAKEAMPKKAPPTTKAKVKLAKPEKTKPVAKVVAKPVMKSGKATASTKSGSSASKSGKKSR